MKNSILTVAILTTSIIFAADDSIVSSTVVGYQTKETVEGFNFIAPVFEKVDASGANIQDIRLGADGSEYSDSIQILDNGGAMAESYLWTADGWIGTDFTLVKRNIDAGQGLLIDTKNAGVKISFPSAL